MQDLLILKWKKKEDISCYLDQVYKQVESISEIYAFKQINLGTRYILTTWSAYWNFSVKQIKND